MFVDYLTLMLINMVAGLVLLACYVVVGLNAEDQRKWAPGFAMTGFIALVTGLHMAFTWPLPGSFNIAFGEMAALYGVSFLGIALATSRNWSLLAVGIYSAVAGAAAILVGFRIKAIGLTQQPGLSSIGFILSGLAGVLLLVSVSQRKQKFFRAVFVAVLLLAAIIWALVGYGALWQHLESFKNWSPATMRGS